MTKKRRRHTPGQIIRKLDEGHRQLAAGKELDEACRHLEIAESTWHRWLAKYCATKTNDVKRLKELEAENARLKKLVANQAFPLNLTGVRKIGHVEELCSFCRREAIKSCQQCGAPTCRAHLTQYDHVSATTAPADRLFDTNVLLPREPAVGEIVDFKAANRVLQSDERRLCTGCRAALIVEHPDVYITLPTPQSTLTDLEVVVRGTLFPGALKSVWTSCIPSLVAGDDRKPHLLQAIAEYRHVLDQLDRFAEDAPTVSAAAVAAIVLRLAASERMPTRTLKTGRFASQIGWLVGGSAALTTTGRWLVARERTQMLTPSTPGVGGIPGHGGEPYELTTKWREAEPSSDQLRACLDARVVKSNLYDKPALRY